MCFSATASFSAAVVLTGLGTASVTFASRRRLGTGVVLLSSFPLLFGIQQAAEGVVWLGVNGIAPAWMTAIATGVFVFAAYVLWPALGPVTGLLIEPPGTTRRKVFAVMLVGGFAVAGYLAYAAIADPKVPFVNPEWGGHIHYLNEFAYLPFIEYPYFAFAATPLLFSSNRVAILFAAVLSAAFAATLMNYDREVMPSVWCFYAALGSAVVLVGLLMEDRRKGLPA